MTNSLSYDDMLYYLYQPSRVKGERSIKTNHERTLEPMVRVLDRLGHPEAGFKMLHVAGSKGKGSTSAMLANILRLAGYRVGLFSSPHLHSYRERMQINGVLPSESEVAEVFARLRPIFDDMPELITFELSTAMAFQLFADRGVEVAVVEVGLGGRLDATNVITPEVSVITALSLEHTAILGNTIEEIAAEKAGIIKPGVPVVASPNPPAALEVIRNTATVRGAPLTQVGTDIPFHIGDATPEGQWFEVKRRTKDQRLKTKEQRQKTKDQRPKTNGHSPQSSVLNLQSSVLNPQSSVLDRFWLPLLGAYQVANAVTAIAAIDIGRERGLAVSEEAIAAGIETVRWPARLEVLGRHPYVVADGAHTADSMRLMLQAIQRHFQYNRLILVFGALADKDVGGMLDQALPHASQVVVARSRYPRSLTAPQLADLVRARGDKLVAAEDDPADGLDTALSLASPDDLVLVTGSLYVAAAAREWWARRNSLPLPEMDPPD